MADSSSSDDEMPSKVQIDVKKKAKHDDSWNTWSSDEEKGSKQSKPDNKPSKGSKQSKKRVSSAMKDAKVDNPSTSKLQGRRPNLKNLGTLLKMPESKSSLAKQSPKRPANEVAFLDQPVRKKLDRARLLAFECDQCRDYYATFELTEEELEVKLKECSRHRAKAAPSKSPEHFWEVDMPSTPECERRGYFKDKAKQSKSQDSNDSF